MTGRGACDSGFVLLEALVAFLVLALVLGTAVQAISVAAVSALRAREAEEVANVAARLFAGPIDRLSGPGVWDGREGRADWRLTASSVGAPRGDRALLAVELQIWRDGRGERPPDVFRTLVAAEEP